jgi:peptidoglycan/LPS O-acetylase OafA/YrhL
VLAVYFRVPAFREREALPPLWKFLSFTQNFGLDLRTGGTFSHAWSLCIEEQYYLLLPFLVLLLSRLRLRWVGVLLPLCLFALGFALRFGTWERVLVPLIDTDSFGLTWYKWMYYPTYNRLDGLLVGVSIAGVWTYYPGVRDFISRYCNWVLILGLGILSYAYYLCLEPRSFGASIFGFPVIALGYGALLMAAISHRCFLYRVRLRVTTSIAGLSYAIYLSHKGIIHITQELAGKIGLAEDGSVVFGLCIATCLIGALILRYVVEKPFMKVRDGILRRRRAGRAVSAVRVAA